MASALVLCGALKKHPDPKQLREEGRSWLGLTLPVHHGVEGKAGSPTGSHGYTNSQE